MTEGKGLFLGVAVTEYDDAGWQPLAAAAQRVVALKELLEGQGYRAEIVSSPSRADLVEELRSRRAMRDEGFQGPAVLVWTGHAEVLDDALSLIVRDTPSNGAKSDFAYRAGGLVSFLADAGSTDSVVILDTCASGKADAELFLKHFAELEGSTWAGQHPSFACIVSCKSRERAEDGAFLGELIDLLANGPGDLDLGIHAVAWGAGCDSVPLSSLFPAIAKRKRNGPHPRTWLAGSSDISFPNPNFDPEAGAALVSDRVREVQGKAPLAETLVETPAATHLIARSAEGNPGLYALTAGPGFGKSSCLSYLAAHSEGEVLLLQAGLGVEALAARVAGLPVTTTVALDSLDEASGRERSRIVALAAGWALTRFVVVASRTESAFDEAGRSAAAELIGRASKVIDLEDADWQGDALSRYLVDRLSRIDDERE
ncbi:MAG: hypothetical protein ABW065_06650 [Solirubrobacterales bacterium]